MSWDTTRDLPWAKIHDRWFTSPSHVDLEDTTLLVGIRMLLLANRRGRQPDGSGHVLNGAGRPMSVEGIARESHSTPERVQRALQELVDVETLEDRGEGLYVFPNLRRWQESPDAARKREARARSLQGDDGGGDDDLPPERSSADITPDTAADIPTDITPDTAADSPGSVRIRGSEDQRIRGSEAETIGSPSADLFGSSDIAPPPPPDTVLTFRCKASARGGTPAVFPLTRRKIEEWKKVFTAINVEAEVRRHHQYFVDNPRKVKTFDGWPSSIRYWLASEDKRARARAARPAPSSLATVGQEVTARGAAAHRQAMQAQHNQTMGKAGPASPESLRRGLELVKQSLAPHRRIDTEDRGQTTTSEGTTP